jgi:hypothetical protein
VKICGRDMFFWQFDRVRIVIEGCNLETNTENVFIIILDIGKSRVRFHVLDAAPRWKIIGHWSVRTYTRTLRKVRGLTLLLRGGIL